MKCRKDFYFLGHELNGVKYQQCSMLKGLVSEVAANCPIPLFLLFLEATWAESVFSALSLNWLLSNLIC